MSHNSIIYDVFIPSLRLAAFHPTSSASNFRTRTRANLWSRQVRLPGKQKSTSSRCIQRETKRHGMTWLKQLNRNMSISRISGHQVFHGGLIVDGDPIRTFTSLNSSVSSSFPVEKLIKVAWGLSSKRSQPKGSYQLSVLSESDCSLSSNVRHRIDQQR